MITPLKSYNGITPMLGKGAFVEASAVLYGDIELGEDVSIWPLVAARGDVNRIRIGARSNIQDGTVLHVTRKSAARPEGLPLLIGEDVTVGHKAMLHACVIGNRVLVGMGAIVLDGAEIGDDVILGAGSLVPPGKKLESGYLYVGSPVKQARPLTAEEKAFLPESAANYVHLKNEYLQQQ
ncbi:carbonic anhydrase/acetyltransferase-like protein (isoleucine patch superfamily) [Oceanisphaera litoralis]|uniref:gamma carbonic anhydrase family protein n=1 Tax=Oceanisphaera litoralis TaxID=225144 RepID=UPI0019588AEC|nr:gamma carbonic anhydrase family protein [Oceanisphaera litoralis]MBM7456175.1 carbonic anhydrase/acetyltransferase-like protein (isoleucine patch superfamily) [Oceanisphaera litoralis]